MHIAAKLSSNAGVECFAINEWPLSPSFYPACPEPHVTDSIVARPPYCPPTHDTDLYESIIDGFFASSYYEWQTASWRRDTRRYA